MFLYIIIISLENYYIFLLWNFKNVSPLLADAKSAFHQGSIIHADSSVLVSFESEAFTDGDTANKRSFGDRRQISHFISFVQMSNIPKNANNTDQWYLSKATLCIYFLIQKYILHKPLLQLSGMHSGYLMKLVFLSHNEWK